MANFIEIDFLADVTVKISDAIAWRPIGLVHEDLQFGRPVHAAPKDWALQVEISLTRNAAALIPMAETFWQSIDNPVANAPA